MNIAVLNFYVTLDENESLKQIGEEKYSVSELLKDFSETLGQYLKK